MKLRQRIMSAFIICTLIDNYIKASERFFVPA